MPSRQKIIDVYYIMNRYWLCLGVIDDEKLQSVFGVHGRFFAEILILRRFLIVYLIMFLIVLSFLIFQKMGTWLKSRLNWKAGSGSWKDATF